jgi:hypothetical protein
MRGIRFLTFSMKQLCPLLEYFTAEEMTTLLKFNITGEIGCKIPRSLSIFTQGRNFRPPTKVALDQSGKYAVSLVTVIPETLFKRPLLKLEEEDVYVTSTSIKNVIHVRPRVDIFICIFSFVGRVCGQTGIVYSKEVNGFVNEFQDDKYKFRVDYAFNDYHDQGCYFATQEQKFDVITGYRFCKPKLLKRNEDTKILLTLNVDSESSYRYFSPDEVNMSLKNCMDRTVFQEIYFESDTGKAPIFLSAFHYVVKH